MTDTDGVDVGRDLVTGLALYVSRGVLDQVLTADGAMRVALLPSPLALVGFLAVGGLGLLLLDQRTLPRGTATAVYPRVGPLVLPLFGLSILLLPYLPWVPDLVPALQMIAGPARPLIWLAIVAQFVWVLWQARLLRADWLQRWTLRRSAVAIGVLTAVHHWTGRVAADAVPACFPPVTNRTTS